MSTRSTITAGSRSIYCHFDGYPSNQVPHLEQHWNSRELAEQLVSGGDMSYLDETPLYYTKHEQKRPKRFSGRERDGTLNGWCDYHYRWNYDSSEWEYRASSDTFWHPLPTIE